MNSKEFWQVIRKLRLSSQLFRVTLAVSLGVVLWLFVKILGVQNRNFDVNAIQDRLITSGEIHPVGSWGLQFAHCVANDAGSVSCEGVGPQDFSLSVTFPAADVLTTMLAKVKPTPNRAILKRKLTPEDRAWLAKNPEASLVLPRSVQFKVRTQVGGVHGAAYGNGVNVQFPFHSIALLEQGEISLDFDVGTLPWFGPADLPVVFANPTGADEYLYLSLRQKLAGNLASQMEVGFPVLLAAIAIVLDHSLVFGLMSLYAGTRALRSYITFSYTQEELVPDAWNQNVLFAGNGLIFALLLIFTLEISGIPIKRNWRLWLFPVLSVAVFLVWGKYDPNFLLTSDLWADALSASLAVPVLIYGVLLVRRRERDAAGTLQNKGAQPSASHGSAKENDVGLGRVLFYVRATLLLSGLVLHAVVNIEELTKFSNLQLKNPLDWKHSMIFPVLITAALFEVGSVARKMVGFAKTMAESAILEQEVLLARDVQQRMLPGRSARGEHWLWRAFYYPASALAGDWFDVRELEFSDGRRILAGCVVDITGHGVGPALVTSTICSQWSLWCMEARGQTVPSEAKAREAMLAEAAKRIHRGLRALGKNDACTAALVLFDPIVHEITFCTAGHPGILMQTPGVTKPKYLRTFSNGLGIFTSDEPSDTETWPCATAEVPPGSWICLYTDGIIPPDVNLAAWVRTLEKSLKKGDVSLVRMLVNQIRQNRRAFRQNRSVEDDITLLLMFHQGQADGLKAAPAAAEVAS